MCDYLITCLLWQAYLSLATIYLFFELSNNNNQFVVRAMVNNETRWKRKRKSPKIKNKKGLNISNCSEPFWSAGIPEGLTSNRPVITRDRQQKKSHLRCSCLQVTGQTVIESWISPFCKLPARSAWWCK